MPIAFLQRKVAIITVIMTVVVVLYVMHSGRAISTLTIYNKSGLDVQFEKVMIDDRIIWGGADWLISKQHLTTPWLDRSPDRVSLEFQSAKKPVELKLVTLNRLHETEVVSCKLDVQSDRCHFEAFYHKGRMTCWLSESDLPD